MSGVRPNPKAIAVFLVLALVGLDVVVASPAEAATFTVTKVADTADGACDTDCSLREAVIAANAISDADTITLPAGTYVLTITGEDEDAAATGDLDITSPLTINGAGSATTIVDGNDSDRVFDVFGEELQVTLNGMTVQGGEQSGSNNVQDDGGGIRVANALGGSDNTLTIRNSVVRDNHAGAGDGDSASGGGIFLSGDDDTLNLDNTKVGTFGFPNTASRGAGIKANGTGNEINLLNGSEVSFNDAASSGGGIFLLGGGHAIVVDNSRVNHNTAGSGTGGGIYIHSGNTDTTVDVRNGSQVNENSAAQFGGGIRAIGASGFALDVTESEILGNIGSSGGGLYLSNPNSAATIVGSRIAFNRALGDCGDGGGIYNTSSAPSLDGPSYSLYVQSGSSIDKNHAACEGGGVQLESVGSMLLRQSSIDHNTAGGSGGGIYGGEDTFFSVEDGAVDLNTSLENGGGIYNGGSATITGESQIVGNSAPGGAGGGFYNGGENGDSQLSIGSPQDLISPIVVANTANVGGGLFNQTGDTTTGFGVLIAGNRAIADDGQGRGGGVANDGFLDFLGVVVGFNVAGGGGGGGLSNASGAGASSDFGLFFGNHTTGSGGAIDNASSGGGDDPGLRLTCSALVYNSANAGGGIFNSEAGLSEVEGCRSIDGGGGGRRPAPKKLARSAQRDLRFAEKVIQQQAPDGSDVIPSDVVDLFDGDFFGRSVIFGNTSRTDGGGINNEGVMEVDRTTIEANVASNARGGGIYNVGPDLFIEASTLVDNFAVDAGGGLHNSGSGSVVMVNDTVSGNYTNGEGGGIRDETAGDTTRLVHVTVTNNSAPDGSGGGVNATNGDVRIAGSIVARNMGGDCAGAVTSEGFNLDSDSSCFSDSNNDIEGVDPQLAPLADNGGDTDTHLPAFDSPAVDGGGDGSTQPCMSTPDDQRGFPRPVNAHGSERCDIGSVELQATEFPEQEPPPSGDRRLALQAAGGIQATTTSDVIAPADNECSLREAIITANTDVAVDPSCTPGDGDYDKVWAPSGFYQLEIAGTGEDASATGDLDITEDVIIAGEGPGNTVVDGNQIDRVFDMISVGSPPVVDVDGLTIQNGTVSDGGGIRNRADLTLTETDVVYNRGACRGGGIFSEGPLLLDLSVVAMNSTTGSDCQVAGGGIFTRGPLSVTNGSLVLLNNTPEEGGGIFNDPTTQQGLSVEGSDIAQNVLTAPQGEIGGAGIYNERNASIIDGSEVVANIAIAGSGGGIYNGGISGPSTLDVADSFVGLNVVGGYGGGIYAEELSITDIQSSDLAGNLSRGGGAVYNSGDMTSFDDIYLFNAAVEGGSGGALYNAGIAEMTDDAVLFNSATNDSSDEPSVTKTRAAVINDLTGGGGGILNDGNGGPEVEEGEENAGLTVTGSLIAGNAATSGSGGGLNNRGVAYVSDSDLADNVAAGTGFLSVGGGGAINCHILYLEDSIVADNVAADGSGGGLLNNEICQTNLTLHLEYSTVSGNVALNSGGGAQNTIGTIDAFNSTISDNFAATGPGGGLADASRTTIHLESVTVAFNSAAPEQGGGVHSGEVDARNTIVGHNYGQDCNAPLTSNGHNIDSDGTCFTGGSDETHPGQLLDLRLGPLAFNGGTTPTHALLPGSPALDQTPPGPACPSDDQRHVTRPQNTQCDIGAFERQSTTGPGGGGGGGGPDPTPSPTPTPTVTEADLAVTKTASPEPVAAGGTLTYTIKVKNNGPGPASETVVTDDLPAQVGIVSASSTQGSCSGSDPVVCQLGTVANGQEVVVTIVVTVGAASGSITNTASATSDTNDPKPDNNAGSVTSSIATGGGPDDIERSVTINIGHTAIAPKALQAKRPRRKLILHGAVIAPNNEDCSSRVPVEVQRKRRKGRKVAKWVKKAQGLTRANGTYKFVLAHRRGKYRAFAPQITVPDGSMICKAAVSRVVKHRHQRR
jgi:uncharacterized repeat protein (TIGR01451 family)/CSLREA domain-containing protein